MAHVDFFLQFVIHFKYTWVGCFGLRSGAWFSFVCLNFLWKWVHLIFNGTSLTWHCIFQINLKNLSYYHAVYSKIEPVSLLWLFLSEEGDRSSTMQPNCLFFSSLALCILARWQATLSFSSLTWNNSVIQVNILPFLRLMQSSNRKNIAITIKMEEVAISARVEKSKSPL